MEKIIEGLDRAVGSSSWADLFPSFGVGHEEFGKSDHRPITVDIEYQVVDQPGVCSKAQV
jgi:hypothetical protein